MPDEDVQPTLGVDEEDLVGLNEVTDDEEEAVVEPDSDTPIEEDGEEEEKELSPEAEFDNEFLGVLEESGNSYEPY